MSNDVQFFGSQNKLKPVNPPEYSISKYIEAKRVLPEDTPFSGPCDNSFTPHVLEILENMSPYSPIQHQAIMKCAQSALTFAAESVLAYWMDECPAPILFVSATDESVEKWSTTRLEPLIESCGFRHKILATTNNPKSRKTGDKTFSKTYVGGHLDMTTARKPAGLASQTKRILIRDEIDRAPRTLSTGEGNWLKVSRARTKSFQHRRKIMDISTPTVSGDSLIYEEYLSGDQRKFFVPCPLCGKHQVLVFGEDNADMNHGLKADRKAGKVERVFYLCEFCHDAFFQNHEMLLKARWEPTSNSYSDVFRSYHLGALSLPFALMSWREIISDYDEALEDPDGMQAFMNLTLGEPYVETGARPKIENVIELRGGYKSGKVPKNVLYLTCGVDVQRGSEKDEKNPARLELEVCGHGLGYRTWSILYKRIEGEVKDAHAGAWEELYNWCMETGLVFKRDDGFKFDVKTMFIDSGDGENTDTVYDFCERLKNTYPSKGTDDLKKKQKGKENVDEQGPQNAIYYKYSQIRPKLFLYTISTNLYKKRLYKALTIPRNQTGPQKANFCDFPIDYGKRYFEMLTAEEQLKNGSFDSRNRRNESLDCRVMNMCAAHVYLDSQVEAWVKYWKDQGQEQEYLDTINTRWVIDWLSAQTARKSMQQNTVKQEEE